MKAGWLGLVGFVLLSVWFVLIMGFSFVEAFLLPHPGRDARVRCRLDGRCSTATQARSTSAPPNAVDAVRAAVHPRRPAVWDRDFRARILPRGAAVLLAVGTVLAPLAKPLSLAAQPKIAIPTGLALAWLGYALMTERRTSKPTTGHRDQAVDNNRMSTAAASSSREVSLSAGIAYVLTFVSIPRSPCTTR